MRRVRVIPVLLVQRGRLVKSIRFSNEKYIGDPINAVKIFNDKEVDEIVILDIAATEDKKEPDFALISDLASECFMPMCYGGGITEIDQVKKIFYSGVEKIALNSSAVSNSEIIGKIANIYGTQSVVVSIDVKRNFMGKPSAFTDRGRKKINENIVSFAKEMERRGAGELLLNSIDRDGTYKGYDLEIISAVTSAVGIPVIACGGAGEVTDFQKAVKAGAAAVAGGSIFVFHGPLKAVLIHFPTEKELSGVI